MINSPPKREKNGENGRFTGGREGKRKKKVQDGILAGGGGQKYGYSH